MDRAELTFFITTALILAVLLGWSMRWFINLLTYGKHRAPDEIEVVNSMRESDFARAEAEERLLRIEREMNNKLSQTQAELDAAMEGLANARRVIATMEQERAEGKA